MWSVPVSNPRPLDCKSDALTLCHKDHKKPKLEIQTYSRKVFDTARCGVMLLHRNFLTISSVLHISNFSSIIEQRNLKTWFVYEVKRLDHRGREVLNSNQGKLMVLKPFHISILATKSEEHKTVPQLLASLLWLCH